jgi:hypothetical protein
MKSPGRMSTKIPAESITTTTTTATMKQLLSPSSTRSVQGTRVQQELEILREKQLAQSQRNKLKDRTYIYVLTASLFDPGLNLPYRYYVC